MTLYHWFAVEIVRLPTALLRQPTGAAGDELRRLLSRPVAGQDAPIGLLGNDPGVDPVVVLVDGWPIETDGSPRTGRDGREGRKQDGLKAKRQYAVVLNASEYWSAALSELEPPGAWDRGTLDLPDGNPRAGAQVALPIVEKWLAALVVAQHWAFSDVAAQLAKLDRGDESGLDAATVYEIFRQRKNRLWWLRASNDPVLQTTYAALQSDYGCIDLHDQMLEETGLWQDHVSRRQISLQNSLLLLLTFAAGALGATSIVATVTSGADVLTGAAASLLFLLVLVAAGWQLAPVHESYRDVREGTW